ncbi:MAG: histidine phosphatase family protein [Planctomycetaceae bacterium]|jgi:phosphohistidine phosphatase SixA|nr:histidine phosphatase family protein [Planctomycetaceae bacterium]
MKTLLSRRGALGFAVLSACALAVAAMRPRAPQEDSGALKALSYPRTIVLVRHAEKDVEPKDDPNLSETGAQRAKRLSDMLAKSGVTHAFATEYQRTQQTLSLLSVACGVNVQVVPARSADTLLSALDSLPRNAIAVVAGHSNTVPMLVEKLSGGQTKVKIDESEYDRLFVVTQWGPGKEARVVELRY